MTDPEKTRDLRDRLAHHLPPRRLGLVCLDARAAMAMLKMPEGQRVVSVNANWLRGGIEFIIEGDCLPEVPPDCEPPRIPADEYVDLHLLDKVRALAERYDEQRDGSAAADLLLMLIATLSGRFDPRTELPS